MKIKIFILSLSFCLLTLSAQNNVTILEYMPAPGQFINTLPSSKDVNTAEDMAALAQENIKRGDNICLGGFGGYITAKFDYPVKNVENEFDILILGNSFGTSAEPGIVMVSKDANKNGIADDKWYEIAGSEYDRSTYNYEISYYKPTAENDAAKKEIKEYIKWEDNQGNKGWLPKNAFHNQSYYPTWINKDTLKFRGTLLPDNAVDKNGDGSYYELLPYDWGYADNKSNNDKDGCSIKLEWAVNEYGKPVFLSSVDFIKIYTGVHGIHGNIGESSTEITSIKGLHEQFIEPDAPSIDDTTNMNSVVLDINEIINYSNITFGQYDIWSKTKNDSVKYRNFGNEWFSFSHLPSGNNYGGNSWEGFTVSKNSDTSTEYETYAPEHQWGCMAGHGVDGEGSPFIIGYYSFFYEQSALNGQHCCSVKFREGGNLVITSGTYVCSTPYVTHSIQKGDDFARKFTKGDYLTLTAHGLDATGEDNGNSIVYYIADYRDEDSTKWVLNNGWDWMDLSGLGAVSGIYFTMESSDTGQFGANTPLYFALDKIKIYTDPISTDVENIRQEQLSIYPNPCRGTLYIENAKDDIVTIFNLQGQIVLYENINTGYVDVRGLNSGLYIVRCGDKTSKLIIE